MFINVPYFTWSRRGWWGWRWSSCGSIVILNNDGEGRSWGGEAWGDPRAGEGRAGGVDAGLRRGLRRGILVIIINTVIIIIVVTLVCRTRRTPEEIKEIVIGRILGAISKTNQQPIRSCQILYFNQSLSIVNCESAKLNQRPIPIDRDFIQL